MDNSPQGSPEWFAFRLGKVSASRVADVMAKTKTGYAASRKNYMMELLCQRLTNKREEGYTNAAMQRGTDLEPVARSWYEIQKGVMVEEVGCFEHPTIPNFVASPDGRIGKGGLEIKCPNTAQHIDLISSESIDGRYQWQMLAQQACAGFEWHDFVSFDDRMPEALQGYCLHFPRDNARIEEMEAEVKKFLTELDELENRMRERMK